MSSRPRWPDSPNSLSDESGKAHSTPYDSLTTSAPSNSIWPGYPPARRSRSCCVEMLISIASWRVPRTRGATARYDPPVALDPNRLGAGERESIRLMIRRRTSSRGSSTNRTAPRRDSSRDSATTILVGSPTANSGRFSAGSESGAALPLGASSLQACPRKTQPRS